MSFDPLHPDDTRLQAWLHRRFPERLIYIRTGGASRTLRLGTRHQVLLWGALALACGWTAYASAMHFAHDAILSSKSQQIASAAAAHKEIIAEIASYRQVVAKVAKEMDTSYAKAMALGEEGASLQREISLLQKRLDDKGGENAKRKKEAERIETLESHYAGLENERQEANRIRERLRGQLSQIDDRMRHLAESGDVGSEVLDLRQAVMQRDMAVQQRDKLMAENHRLSDRLEKIQGAQKQIFEQVSGLADDGITQIERSLRKTGINLEDLLGQEAVSNRGGPFVPAELPDLGREDLNRAMQELNDRLDRWEGLNYLMSALPLGFPVDNPRITSGFGYRRDPFTGEPAMHPGVDFQGQKGETAHATASGIVVSAGYNGNYGLCVEIDHGLGFTTRYAHLASTTLKVGDEVKQGATVGMIGSSGRSTGIHVHYEVRYKGQPYNPKEFVRVRRYVQKKP